MYFNYFYLHFGYGLEAVLATVQCTKHCNALYKLHWRFCCVLHNKIVYVNEIQTICKLP